MKQQKTSLIFSVAMATFLTTGVAQADLNISSIFSLLEEVTYPNGASATAESDVLSDADKAALEAIFAMEDESIDVNTPVSRVDMASMETIGSERAEVTRSFNINQTGFTVIDLNM